MPKNRAISLCADWIQHVIDTKAEPYLWTPHDQLPWLVRHSFDVYSFLLAILIAGACVLKKMISILMQAWKVDSPCIPEIRQKLKSKLPSCQSIRNELLPPCLPGIRLACSAVGASILPMAHGIGSKQALHHGNCATLTCRQVRVCPMAMNCHTIGKSPCNFAS